MRAARRRPRSRSGCRRACARASASVRRSSHRSFGHFRPMRGGASSTGGSSASASATPTASDRPDQSRGASGSASEKVSDAPGADCQPRPWRPRPRGLVLGHQQAGLRVAGAAAVRLAPSARRRSCRALTGALRWPLRARSSSRVLVDSARATHLDAQARQQRLELLPQRLGAPVQVAAGRAWASAGLAALSASAPASCRGSSRLPQRHSNCFFSFGGVALVDHQAVVVEQLLARLHVAQRLDEDAAVHLVGLAVGLAGVVDPARRIAADVGVDDVLVVDVEVEGVVRVVRVVRVAAQRLLPGDDLAVVLDDASRPRRCGCSANTPLPCTPLRRTWMRRPPRGRRRCGWGSCGGRWLAHGLSSLGTLNSWARACARVRASAREGTDCRHAHGAALATSNRDT